MPFPWDEFPEQVRDVFRGFRSPAGEEKVLRDKLLDKDPQMFVQGSSEEELRAICEGLFVPQRDQGIHAGGAERGNVAGHQRGKRQYNGDDDIGERIAGTYAEQQCGHRGQRKTRPHCRAAGRWRRGACRGRLPGAARRGAALRAPCAHRFRARVR
jgi:hypothetical protein